MSLSPVVLRNSLGGLAVGLEDWLARRKENIRSRMGRGGGYRKQG